MERTRSTYKRKQTLNKGHFFRTASKILVINALLLYASHLAVAFSWCSVVFCRIPIRKKKALNNNRKISKV